MLVARASGQASLDGDYRGADQLEDNSLWIDDLRPSNDTTMEVFDSGFVLDDMDW